MFRDFDAVHSGPRQPTTPASFGGFYDTRLCWRVREAARTALIMEKNALTLLERAKKEAIPLANAFLAPSGDEAALGASNSRCSFDAFSAVVWNIELAGRKATLAKLRAKAAQGLAMDAVAKHLGDPRCFKVNRQGGVPYRSTRRFGNTFFCLTGPGVSPLLRGGMRRAMQGGVGSGRGLTS